MISSRWRQRRIWGIETALLDLQMDKQMQEIQDQFNRIDETTRTAIAYQTLADTSKSLTQTTRHEALFSRQYRLAMKTLIQMQRERKETNLQNEPKPPTEIIPITRIQPVATTEIRLIDIEAGHALPSPDSVLTQTPSPTPIWEIVARVHPDTRGITSEKPGLLN